MLAGRGKIESLIPVSGDDPDSCIIRVVDSCMFHSTSGFAGSASGAPQGVYAEFFLGHDIQLSFLYPQSGVVPAICI